MSLAANSIASAAAHFSRNAPNQSIINALSVIGNPDLVVAPVHVPMRSAATDAEKETFKWFVHNDDTTQHGPAVRQALGAIDGDELPVLKRH